MAKNVFGTLIRRYYCKPINHIINPIHYNNCELKHNSPARMRFVQFLRNKDSRKHLGVVSDDGNTLVELSNGPSVIANDMITFIRQNYSVAEIKEKIKRGIHEETTDGITFLPPVMNPDKIICVGLNYTDHCAEKKRDPPKAPMFYSKFNNSLVGARDDVIKHEKTKKLDWEIELAVVMGKKCKNITRDKAFDYIFGYTIAQDISARDWQKERNGGQFLIGKSMNTFLPLGPTIVHKSVIKNPHNLELICKVNGVKKQHSITNRMIFKVDDIVSRLSQFITLMPGDVILTGTPQGVGINRNPPEYLKVGDVIESEIQCMGKLMNTVVAP